MLYLDYHRFKVKYLESQQIVSEILDEKTVIFQKTQPKSPLGEYEREHDKEVKIMSSGGTKINPTEAYVVEIEQRHINERLSEAKMLMMDRRDLLRQKEEELRASKDRYDLIYVLKYLERLPVGEIAGIVSYSESHVSRMLQNISKSLEMIENARINQNMIKSL